jgi:hypothetical protein|tara:strand:- start:1883 stop:2251 length:369 start_codon:yes stop_codon:yes gene_type:complete
MSAYKKQIGGSHYKNMKIQPSKFINDNKLLFAEGNAIKYICRHKQKGERQDLEKAKHYIDMILERDYPLIPMTEEEEYRNAGITKEEAERTYPPQNSWGMIKPSETSNKDWIKGYKEWKNKS